MGKTVYKNSTEEEKKFFEGFEKNINQSDNFQDFIKYGFFHFTPAENLKKGRDGEEDKGIEDVGMEPAIGKNSEGFEDKKRSYYAIGAEGVMGLANRIVLLSTVKLIEEAKLSPEKAKQKAFEETMQIFDEAVYLKMNIDDGIEYDSSDFMTKRNSHTITNAKIPPEKLEMLTVNGSTNGLDILQFFYENCDPSKIRLSTHEKNGTKYIEENYIEELMGFILENSMEQNPRTITSSTLKKLDLAEKKKEYEEASLTFGGKSSMEKFAKGLLEEGLRFTELDEVGKETISNFKNKDISPDLDEQDKGVGQ